MEQQTHVQVIESATPELESWAQQWFEPWFAAVDEAAAFERVDPVLAQRDETLTSLRRPTKAYRKFVLTALDGDRVVGGAVVDLPQLDNRNLVQFELFVAPGARRRGHGSALLAAVRDLAKADGRTTFQVDTDRPADRADWPGVAFLLAHGFRLGQAAVRRDLPLPADEAVLRALEEEARERSAGYRVLTWTGPAPADDRDRLARLMARMSTDAPLGELEYEPEVWDGDRVAAYETRQQELGRTWWTAVAVAEGGEWAGYTQLGWSPQEPDRLYQWDTLVLAGHRGHRLGLLLKLHLMRLVVPQVPGATRVTTWNAENNEPMIAVNEAMGYRVVEAGEEWQGEVGALSRL